MASVPVETQKSSFSEYFDLRTFLRYLKQRSLFYRFQNANTSISIVKILHCSFERFKLSLSRSLTAFCTI